MNKLCKKYISNVRAFFPIKGKLEKKYLRDLATTVNDFCEGNNPASLEVLYKEFGTPNEVVNSYFSTVNTDYVIKRIRFSKIVKIVAVLLLIIALITSIIFCSYIATAKRVVEKLEGSYFETYIE